MRVIGRIVVLLIVALVAVVAYNYWSGRGWTVLPSAPTVTGIDAEKVRETGGELARKAADTTKVAMARTEKAASEATLTAKIKSKMALDDYVKARTIDVDTEGTIVTLSGTVQSEQERQRALRLATETAGVSRVVDKLAIANR